MNSLRLECLSNITRTEITNYLRRYYTDSNVDKIISSIIDLGFFSDTEIVITRGKDDTFILTYASSNDRYRFNMI